MADISNDPTALAHFGKAFPEIALTGVVPINVHAKVFTAAASVDFAAAVLLPVPNTPSAFYPTGGLYFIIANTDNTNTFFVFNEFSATIATLGPMELCRVDLVEASPGNMAWVAGEARAFVVGSDVASALVPHIIHGKTNDGFTTLSTKIITTYDPKFEAHATASTAGAAIASMQSTSASIDAVNLNIYLVGSSVAPLSDFFQYDSVTDTYPVSQPGGPSWTLGGGAFSGTIGSGASTQVWEYGLQGDWGSFSLGSWTKRGTDGPTYFGGVGEMLDGRYLYQLGSASNRWYECNRMDTLSSSFTRLGAFARRQLMPPNKRTGSGGKIGTAGQEFEILAIQPDSDVYNTAQNTWRTVTAFPGTATSPGGSSYAGSFYAFGGGTGADGDQCYSYNPTSDAWATETDLPLRRVNIEQAVVSGSHS